MTNQTAKRAKLGRTEAELERLGALWTAREIAQQPAMLRKTHERLTARKESVEGFFGRLLDRPASAGAHLMTRAVRSRSTRQMRLKTTIPYQTDRTGLVLAGRCRGQGAGGCRGSNDMHLPPARTK